MRRELLIAPGPGEWRAALTEDGVPVELYVERGNRFAADSIHLGRVVRRVPALAAALVEIGDERPGFLPLRDAIPAAGPLDDGARILVQVRREAQRDKAARLSTRVALQGRVLALSVGRAAAALDDAIPADDRARLLAAAAEAGGARLALIGRADELPPIQALVDETASLAGEWRAIAERATRHEPPVRLDQPASFAVALAARLPGAPDLVVADDPAVRGDLRAIFPGADKTIAGELPLDVDAVFAAAIAGRVSLGGNGSIHIEATHAATLIDVDTGTPERGPPARVALAANLAAAQAIAQQLRLRNIAGPVVIDFVGIEGRAARERVREAIAAAVTRDPAAPQLLGWTRLGHFELLRARRGPALADTLLEPAPGGAAVKSAATVAHEALRKLARAARQQPAAEWRLVIAPAVAAALGGAVAHDALAALEARLGRRIEIAADANRAHDSVEIVPR